MAANLKAICIVCGVKSSKLSSSSLQKFFALASNFQEEMNLEQLKERGVCESCEVNLSLAGNANEKVKGLEEEMDKLAEIFFQKLKVVTATKKQILFGLKQMQGSMKGRKEEGGLEQADVNFRKITEKALIKTKESVKELEEREKDVAKWICVDKAGTSAGGGQTGSPTSEENVSGSSTFLPPTEFEATEVFLMKKENDLEINPDPSDDSVAILEGVIKQETEVIHEMRNRTVTKTKNVFLNVQNLQLCSRPIRNASPELIDLGEDDSQRVLPEATGTEELEERENGIAESNAELVEPMESESGQLPPESQPTGSESSISLQVMPVEAGNNDEPFNNGAELTVQNEENSLQEAESSEIQTGNELEQVPQTPTSSAALASADVGQEMESSVSNAKALPRKKKTKPAGGRDLNGKEYEGHDGTKHKLRKVSVALPKLPVKTVDPSPPKPQGPRRSLRERKPKGSHNFEAGIKKPESSTIGAVKNARKCSFCNKAFPYPSKVKIHEKYCQKKYT